METTIGGSVLHTPENSASRRSVHVTGFIDPIQGDRDGLAPNGRSYLRVRVPDAIWKGLPCSVVVHRPVQRTAVGLLSCVFSGPPQGPPHSAHHPGCRGRVSARPAPAIADLGFLDLVTTYVWALRTELRCHRRSGPTVSLERPFGRVGRSSTGSDPVPL